MKINFCDSLPFNKIDDKINSDGFLEAEAIITAAGVIKYTGAITNESGTTEYRDVDCLRSPSELFKEETINSIRMLQVTNEHPPSKVDIDNAKNFSIGFIGDSLKRDEDALIARIKITDKEAIDKIREGKHQLSFGYSCDIYQNKGQYNNLPYECEIKNIRGNHIALTNRGRLGEKAIMLLDSNECMIDLNNFFTDGDNMETENIIEEQENIEPESVMVVISGKEFMLPAEVATEIEMLREALKAANYVTSKTDLTDSVEANKKEVLLKEISELQKTSESMQKELFFEQVKRYNLADSITDNLQEKDIYSAKCAILNKFNPNLKISEKSEEYVKGLFDALIESKKKNNLAKQYTSLNRVLNDSRTPQERVINDDNALFNLVIKNK